MKPDVTRAAGFLANMLREDIVPELTGFRAGNVSMTAAMLDMIAEEWDRAAARLVAENADFAALLGNDAVKDATPDLRISALTARNEDLRTRLIALHADVETRDDPQAKDTETTIWAALRRSVEARRIASANF
ncbi:MAG: hypothetical protein M0R03_17865 [Novosphingobium sp.]|nr:hypothetical protein [Novosphingobium sp.]